ncbi:hypothetical protein GNI_108690, partial [Gregarina niphandrodes]
MALEYDAATGRWVRPGQQAEAPGPVVEPEVLPPACEGAPPRVAELSAAAVTKLSSRYVAFGTRRESSLPPPASARTRLPPAADTVQGFVPPAGLEPPPAGFGAPRFAEPPNSDIPPPQRDHYHTEDEVSHPGSFAPPPAVSEHGLPPLDTLPGNHYDQTRPGANCSGPTDYPPPGGDYPLPGSDLP